MANPDKISAFETQFRLKPALENGELSEKVLRKCSFCEKNCETNNTLGSKIAGPEFYCDFCLRNNLYTKSNRDILPLSFRPIFAYLYFSNYLFMDRPKIWISEIQDLIDIHCQVGFKNPVFRYDPESFLWFVDFSKIGNSPRRISLEEINKTILNILVCFNLKNVLGEQKMAIFYQKYKDAIQLFYEKRQRPSGRRLLIPTFANLLVEPKMFSLEKTRNFIFADLQKKI